MAIQDIAESLDTQATAVYLDIVGTLGNQDTLVTLEQTVILVVLDPLAILDTVERLVEQELLLNSLCILRYSQT